MPNFSIWPPLSVAGALVSIGCVSSELPAGADHPAHPQAAAEPPARASSALEPSFEPFRAYGLETAEDSPEEHEHGHEHAAHQDGPPIDAGTAADADAGVLYVCPMHPEVQKNAPGRCPICKMKLVPRRPGGAP